MKKTSPTTAELRAWARSKGIDVGDRGRLSPEVLDAWHAAHGDNGGATPAKKPAAKKPAAKKPAAKRPPAKKAPSEPRPVMATKPPVAVEKPADEATLITTLTAQVTSLTRRVEQLENAARATPPQRRSLFRKA